MATSDQTELRQVQRKGRASRVIVTGMVAAGIVAATMAALASQGWSVDRLLNTCVGQEGDAFPELEQVAEETFRGVESRTKRYSGCDDTGKPGPAIHAVLLDWRLREQAATHLARSGWTQEGGPLTVFFSPDGKYLAGVVMTTESGETHPKVYFNFAD
jgi:hypothetical protein